MKPPAASRQQSAINIGLIGYPIEQSLSPKLHNEFFRLSGVKGSYNLWSLPERGMLANFVDKARHKNIRGFNVTIPHKLSVISYLDELEELAARIGSVNTVVNIDGEMKGYNTDVQGVRYLLESNLVEISNRSVALLGSGGAARAAAVVLAESDCDIFCIVRDLNSINVTQMQNICDRIYFVQDKTCAQALMDCEIIVNALPPQAAAQLFAENAEIIREQFFFAVIDLNYFSPSADFVGRFNDSTLQ